MNPKLLDALRLVLVTDDRLLAGRDLVEVCRSAERGGVTAVQLRLKELPPRDLVMLVRRLGSSLGIPVLVNDRLDVALAGGAAGVHLGPDDLPVDLARAMASPGFLLGASVGSPAEAELGEWADYWGIGPYKPSRTKSDAGTALGIDGTKAIVQGAPPGMVCVAIGGLEPEDIGPAFAAGVQGVAVVSGLLRHADIESAARRYVAALERC
jgi:thiamine-phosphate pyrophosphorylase